MRRVAFDPRPTLHHRPSGEKHVPALSAWATTPVLATLAGLMAVSCFGDDFVASRGTSPAAVNIDDPQEAAVRIGPDRTAEEQTARPVPAEIQQLFSRLESAGEFLRGTKHYAAKFTQQVSKDGRLLKPEQMALKVQHEPFAVYMQWERDGQQALYVDGAHDNKLLVHPTRGVGRLRRVWILEPDSRLAMRTSLRPVTEIGMLNIVDLLLGFHEAHILHSHCVSEPVQDAGRPLTRYVLTFDSPEVNPYFAKTYLWLSDERHLPVRIENYSWTEDNHVGPLLESYDYSDICLDQCVTAADFDRDNEAYSF